MTILYCSRLPDSANDTIRQLAAQGHSWRQIASKVGYPLGTVMTRGKNLGIKTKQSRCFLAKAIPAKPVKRGKTRAYVREPVNPHIIDNGLGHAINTATSFRQDSSIPLMDAGPDHCRWPVDGDGDPRCCGREVAIRSYCVDHAKRAFNGS